MRTERLSRAVPTLDLRRKQLNREILAWEERLLEVERRYEDLSGRMEQNPHPEIEFIVEVSNVSMRSINIAGAILEEVDKVSFEIKKYSLMMTPPSFDIFVTIRRDMLEAKAIYDAMKAALDILKEELAITTQRINLFEKKLIPEYQEEIRYIRGRLEDGERTSVMVAKIAQAHMK